METQLRRNQIALVTLGTGTILFGVWSVIKTVLYLLAGPSLDSALEGDPSLTPIIKFFIFLILSLLMLIDLSLRLFVGRAARAEGMGKKPKSAYLYLAGLLLAFSAVVDLYSLYSFFTGTLKNQSGLDYAVSMLVELNSLVLLAGLIVTGRRVRKLRGQTEG